MPHSEETGNDLMVSDTDIDVEIPLDDSNTDINNDQEDDSFDSLAPPENLWYHGKLDRLIAERRLWQFGKAGSYLARESERKHGSYVLSYLGVTGINHFRITAVCGDFYIGGQQFHSLAQLISYYTHECDLVNSERLKYPVAPPEPVNDKKRIVAILPYTKMPETDELSFQKGDIFFVHNDMGDGWLWVTAHRTGEQGMIFRELVQDLEDNIDPNTVFSWFHPNITKAEAVDMLVKAGPGSFLVRPSDNSPGDYSLFFHVNNQIQRYRIAKKGVRYIMGGRTFECLDAVINRYRKEPIVEGRSLALAILRNNTSETEADGNHMFTKPKEVQQPEKIYATLRECRDQVGLKKLKGIKMQSYLMKKNEKNKKWKNLYTVLMSEENANGGGNGDVHLCFYENPKKTKPKGLVDLSCAYLYQLHDSVFERTFCFQLVERALPCIATITHLSAKSAPLLQDWINALRPYCITQVSRACKTPKLREMRSLQLRIMDAHRLPEKLVPNPFFVISLNQVVVAKTKVKTGASSNWEEEFILDEVAPDVLTFSLTLYNKGRRSKDTEVAYLTVDLSNLPNGVQCEKWYSLSGVTPIGEWGSVRLSLCYWHDFIMPINEYSPLLQLILEPEFTAVKALSEVSQQDKLSLANILFQIFRYEGKEADLMKSLNEGEVAKEGETCTLFRGASLASSVMDIYMKSTCKEFLEAALQSTIVKLLESKVSCELNPEKMESGDDVCANAEFLLQVLDNITLSIFMSANTCPRTLRYICGCLQKNVMAKWPHERLVRTRVISGFIFLRLLCPAILNPRHFNLITETPSPWATRSLVMVAKCLQNLANLVEFGGKEPYMEVVNPFILKNKERMVVFLDSLSNLNEKPEGEDSKVVKGNLDRPLAMLHHLCLSHITELQQLAKTQSCLKKLVTVTEMIQKHKERYMEMLN